MLLRTPALVLAWAALAAGCGSPNQDRLDQAASRDSDDPTRGAPTAEFPRTTELAPNVFAYEYLRPPELGGTTNSLIIVTSEGVVVADGQGSAEETGRLLETIDSLTEVPVRYVVVGSDHGDHVAGNSAFPAGTSFIAHPTSAAVIASADPPLPPVDILVRDELSLHLGGVEIKILHLGRAHTGGDLAVYLPAERILFMSEIFFSRLFPSMRSAFPSEWIQVIEQAQTMDVDVYVPGHGFIDRPSVLAEELEEYKRAMRAVISETTRLHDAGLSVEEAIARADFGVYESWTGRDRQVERAIPRIYAELEGRLPDG